MSHSSRIFFIDLYFHQCIRDIWSFQVFFFKSVDHSHTEFLIMFYTFMVAKGIRYTYVLLFSNKLYRFFNIWLFENNIDFSICSKFMKYHSILLKLVLWERIENKSLQSVSDTHNTYSLKLCILNLFCN